MTSPSLPILTSTVAMVLVLAGCSTHLNHDPRRQDAASASSAPTTSAKAAAASQAPQPADPDPVAVARAFTGEICPYSWRDSRPYGQRLNAALARWGTGRFVAAHSWPPGRIATAAAGLVEHQAVQVCGQVTGGLDPDATAPAGSVQVQLSVVRLSVTVTARSSTGAASRTQQVFTFELVRRGARWLIDNGQW